jgi:prevent-host-death family protein
MKESTFTASEFKARCLRLLDEVAEQGNSLIITKRGRPIARVAPLGTPKSLRGTWAGIVKIRGDAVNFHDDWGPDDEYLRSCWTPTFCSGGAPIRIWSCRRW